MTTETPLRSVIAQADALNRQIYASLPWGYRLANVLFKLASDSIETFGRFFYAEFIKAGVTEMPDIGTVPALDFQDKLKGPSGPSKLPRNYGRDFGKKVYSFLLSKTRDIETVEEVLSQLMLKASSGGVRIKEGARLNSAESYVYEAAKNLLKDVIKMRSRRLQTTDPKLEEDEVFTPADPNSFSKLDDLLSQSELRNLVRDLAKIDPRMESWLEAKINGDSGREIAQAWNVSPAMVSMWESKNLPKIKRAIGDYLRDAA